MEEELRGEGSPNGAKAVTKATFLSTWGRRGRRREGSPNGAKGADKAHVPLTGAMGKDCPIERRVLTLRSPVQVLVNAPCQQGDGLAPAHHAHDGQAHGLHIHSRLGREE